MPHIFGQLIRAQLENYSGTPPVTYNVPGMIYADSTVPAKVVPRMYTGTTWRPISLSQTTPYITTTATTPYTVVVCEREIEIGRAHV